MTLPTQPLVIVQARLESQRLPNKMIRHMLQQPMLLWLLQRLQLSIPHKLIVALPDSAGSHDCLKPMLECHGYTVAIPPVPPDDVLARYAEVVHQWPEYTPVVRLTGDCPLIDAAVIEQILGLYNPKGDDYAALTMQWPDGLDVEVMRPLALLHAHKEAVLPSDREHVTPFIWRNPRRFRQVHLPCPLDLSAHCWSVDTYADFHHVRELFARLFTRHGANWGWKEVYADVEAHPDVHQWATSRQRNQAYVDQVLDELREPIPPCEQGWAAIRYSHEQRP